MVTRPFSSWFAPVSSAATPARRAAVAALVLVVALTVAPPLTGVAIAPVSAADDDPAPVEIQGDDCGAGRIIPDPSEGCEPQTPGDPGGWQQLTLLAMVIAALAVIGFLVRRQLRQAQRLRNIDTDPTDPPDPARRR